MSDHQYQETHVREWKVRLNRYELERLIAKAVCEQIREPRLANPALKNVTRKVQFEDETEGSPSYKTGVKATVTIVEDLTTVQEADPRP